MLQLKQNLKNTDTQISYYTSQNRHTSENTYIIDHKDLIFDIRKGQNGSV